MPLDGRVRRDDYRYPGQVRSQIRHLPRERQVHGNSLLSAIDEARRENAVLRGVATTEADKIILEISGDQGLDLDLKPLESESRGIRLACVREDQDTVTAVVHVPGEQLTYLVGKIEKYLAEDTPAGRPKNQRLVESIAALRLANLRAFWTDSSAFPDAATSIWWEVWLRAEIDDVWSKFKSVAQTAGLRVGGDTLSFPGRLVGLCWGTANQLSSSTEILDLLGEVRAAKDNPAEFLSMSPVEKNEWVENLLGRLRPPPAGAPAVCLLDGGVHLHPLIAPALSEEDCQKHDPAWPLTDSQTHGTELAGIALYGDLFGALVSSGPVELDHRLESVKILPPRPLTNERRLYGTITLACASRIETVAPTRRRAFCLAITNDGIDCDGSPTSWSGALDQACSGARDGVRRLMFVSAGNLSQDEYGGYPDVNDVRNVEDPAQAWNAVAVGAFTERIQFPQDTYPGFVPVAPAGDLSPCSRTSLSWENTWPFKPDIVLEGGNAIRNPETGIVDAPDQMSLLSTGHAPFQGLFVPTGDTSGATALAARIGALIEAGAPGRYWPESVRGLIVHSAEWTPAMLAAFNDPEMSPTDQNRARLRRYGYGVPNLEKALFSARNALTLVAQESLQPFVREDGRGKTKDMHIFDLPWPIAELTALGERLVTMRVTLSYFIEPKPGRLGGFAQTKHRYQSHGLRFEVRRPQESLEDFRRRISAAAREEGEEFSSAGATDRWQIGPKLRARGSILSDWWTGTAAELAARQHLAIFPVSGWWREDTDEQVWSRKARYSLIVTLKTEDVGVDLYTPIETIVRVPVPTPIA